MGQIYRPRGQPLESWRTLPFTNAFTTQTSFPFLFHPPLAEPCRPPHSKLRSEKALLPFINLMVKLSPPGAHFCNLGPIARHNFAQIGHAGSDSSFLFSQFAGIGCSNLLTNSRG